jgi:hypothetical protein
MVGPTNLKPRRIRSLLSDSASGVFAGGGVILALALDLGPGVLFGFAKNPGFENFGFLGLFRSWCWFWLCRRRAYFGYFYTGIFDVNALWLDIGVRPGDQDDPNIYTVLSDGQFLYVLNSSSTATFKALNGSAGAPAFSFLNDGTTGMYLSGTGVLGLSANGTELIDINGSNLSSPIVTVKAQLNATSITGGTF